MSTPYLLSTAATGWTDEAQVVAGPKLVVEPGVITRRAGHRW